MTAVHDLVLTRAGKNEAQRGLLGYLACRVGALHLDGLTLRRTRRGRLTVSFPCRRDRHGRKHYLVRPADPGVEAAILAAVEEPLNGLGPSPGGAHVDAPAQGEEPEEWGAHRGQGTARRRER